MPARPEPPGETAAWERWGRGPGEGSAICLSISASPQRLSPAVPRRWRDELPPALDALCSVAKRALRARGVGAGRALGGPAPPAGMLVGEAGRVWLGDPGCPREGSAFQESLLGFYSPPNSSVRTEKD